MGTIVEKTINMDTDDWRRRSAEAKKLAVRYLNDDVMLEPGGSARGLTVAADLLRAAREFERQAIAHETFGEEPVSSTVDVWDISDEVEVDPDAPAWPVMSAKMREIAGADPKLLALVDQIDRLHALNVEKGHPVVTLGQLRSCAD
jgi:hypothetical protein